MGLNTGVREGQVTCSAGLKLLDNPVSIFLSSCQPLCKLLLSNSYFFPHHPSGCCTLVVVEERPPPHDCKALWVYNNTKKALYKCIIHSFIHSFFEAADYLFHRRGRESAFLKVRDRRNQQPGVSDLCLSSPSCPHSPPYVAGWMRPQTQL